MGWYWNTRPEAVFSGYSLELILPFGKGPMSGPFFKSYHFIFEDNSIGHGNEEPAR